MRKNGVIERLLVTIALAIVLGPLLWVVRVALKPEKDYIRDPSTPGGGWTFENFSSVWTSGGMQSAVINSLITVSVGATIAILLATATGYALARYKFKGHIAVGALITMGMFLPAAALVIPIFEILQRFQGLDSLIWLGVVYGTLFSAWATIFLRSYFIQVPVEVFEAADVDGAGPLRQFFSIALPMAKPAIATAFILSCFLQWSELLLGLLLLPSGRTATVAVAIAQFSSQFRTGGPITAAAMLIGTAPVLLLFIFGQRWLRLGALSGAVKD